MSTEKRVIAGAKTRFAYLNVKRPKIDEGGKLKYGACLLIPKDDEETLDKISDAVWTAYETAIYPSGSRGSVRICSGR